MKQAAKQSIRRNSKMDREIANERAVAARLALTVIQDIRDPLQAIGNLCYLAEQNAQDPIQVKNYMHEAGQQLRYFSHTTNQTLIFTKCTDGVIAADDVEIDETAAVLHQQTVSAEHIHLVRNVPSHLPVSIQDSRILQMMIDLIAIARDATTGEGHFTVSMRRRSSRVEFVVADHGSGISPEAMEKLFDPSSSTKQVTGDGSGPSLSKGIIGDHKGKMCVIDTFRPRRNDSILKVQLPLSLDSL